MQVPSITIRAMETRDAVEVATLAGELGYPMAPGVIEDRLNAVRASSPSQPTDILVAVDRKDGRVVGWVHVCVPLFLTGSRAGSVWGLVVASTHRNRGVGRLLMDAAEQWAVDQDCTEMRLTSAVQREAAHAFYERLGYRVEKSQLVFVRSLVKP